MQPPSHGPLERHAPETHRHPASRAIAMTLAGASLAVGVYGVASLPAESFNMGLLVFGCLLALLALLAQSAEHFARGAARAERIK